LRVHYCTQGTEKLRRPGSQTQSAFYGPGALLSIHQGVGLFIPGPTVIIRLADDLRESVWCRLVSGGLCLPYAEIA
jgi:hypothetical protein